MSVTVTQQSKSGRNEKFNVNGKELTRAQFCKEIKAGKHENFYVRNINGKKIPVSKPDGNKRNNLG
ncbi:DUF3892 domain-containing protein [Mollicutes bacterium LVI A0078]|nr:DUF3892 domain-containing protein [Mollicutes bacterium LVI A0075]WOO91178.1 DUF3892 domain-containing protein [Mollicutes bacterium LVI A0078]